MSGIKQAMGKLNEAFQEEIASSENEFLRQKSNLVSCYDNLITACDTYINNHHPWSPTGKARLSQAKYQKAMATIEKKRIEARATELRKDVKEDRPLWVNVLAEARTEHLNLKDNKYEETNFGGSCNMVKQIKVKSDKNKEEIKGYIKETVNMPSLKANIEGYCNEINTESNQDKRGKVSAFLKDLTNCLFENKNGKLKFNNAIFQQISSDDRKIRPKIKYDDRGGIEAYIKAIEYKELSNAIYNGMRDDLKGNYSKLFEHEEDIDINKEALTKKFLSYCYLKRGQYLMGKQINLEEGSNITNRNVATSRMAELLGVKDIVANSSKISYVDTDGKLKKGIIMEDAGDLEYADAKGTEISSKGIMDLANLYILDIICGQVDRNFGNIMVKSTGRYGKDKIEAIKGIDNDFAFGNLSYSDMKQTRRGKMDWIIIFEKNFTKNVLEVSDEAVKYVMADLLTEKEMDSLLNRLHGVQKHIGKIKKKLSKCVYRKSG